MAAADEALRLLLPPLRAVALRASLQLTFCRLLVLRGRARSESALRCFAVPLQSVNRTPAGFQVLPVELSVCPGKTRNTLRVKIHSFGLLLLAGEQDVVST